MAAGSERASVAAGSELYKNAHAFSTTVMAIYTAAIGLSSLASMCAEAFSCSVRTQDAFLIRTVHIYRGETQPQTIGIYNTLRWQARLFLGHGPWRHAIVDDGWDAVLWLRAIGGACRVHGLSCRLDGRLSQVGAVLRLPILHPHRMRTASAIAGAPHRRRGDQHVGVDAAAWRRGRGMCVEHAQHARHPCPCS